MAVDRLTNNKVHHCYRFPLLFTCFNYFRYSFSF